MYELRLMVIPPVIKEVIGHYDKVDDALKTVKKLIIEQGRELEDFDLENLKTGELLHMQKKEVMQ